MKQIIPKYTFDASAKTITFLQRTTLAIERLALITNITTGDIIYQFNNPLKGGVLAGNVLTLDFNTTAMADSDKLRIDYDAITGEPIYDKVVVGNAQKTFRDGFATTGITQPNPENWDLINDATDAKTGHIITQGGNSAGSSYLRISLSPFEESSGVVLNSKVTFGFPMRVGFGVSMSQRVVGQEVFVGMVGATDGQNIDYDTPVADKPITGPTVTVASNVATFTLTNHGFTGGDRINIAGCADHRLNVGPVVVTVVDKNTFTVPITLANASTYSTTNGYVRTIDPMRYARNAGGLLFEATSATGASFVSRRNGAKFRSSNQTIASTAASQTNTNPYTDAFNAASNQELYFSLDELSYRSYATDANSGMSGANKYSQNIPDDDLEYKIQIRARNLNGLTVPVGRITAISKAGSTTATVTTDVPHGLAAGDFVQIYGVRDQTNFANLTTQTAIASVPTSTTFTVVLGSSVTASSAGGVVWANQGQVAAPGVISQVIQSIARTNNVLTITANTTVSGLLPGEYVQLHGLEPSGTAYEGAYKVLRQAGSTLELESTGADFTSITTGGAIIKRTDVRLHFARVLDYTRLVTEISGGRGNTTDANNAVPVSITAGVALGAVQSTGINTTQWSAAGWGGFLVNDIASAAITSTATSAAITPGSTANIGTYAHSFSVIVTAATGTTPTLDVSIEESPDNGTNWVRIYDFPRITATGTYTTPIIPATWGTRYRYVRTVGGTSPSFTMSLNRMQFSTTVPMIRQFFDRSIVLTTANSTTPSYYVDRAKVIQVMLTLLAATTPPVLTIEGSEDNVNWYALPGATLTGVANSTEVVYIVNVAPKFVRARVSTIGATITAGWHLNIKALED